MREELAKYLNNKPCPECGGMRLRRGLTPQALAAMLRNRRVAARLGVVLGALAGLALTLPFALPNWHYLHIHNDVLPALRQRGVTEEQITTMLVDNPAEILRNRGGY